MSTLYVSDLDGSLLRSDERVSEFTCDAVNDLVSRGMIFSYATARSLVTAKKVTRGLNAKIPLIVYNGAFVMDNVTGEILIANYFDDSVVDVLEDLFRQGIYPLVYAYIDGQEKFSYVPRLCTRGMEKFLNTRKGDVRTNEVETPDQLLDGSIFYITCIDEPEKLEPFYEKYRDRYHCVYERDLYSEEQWLEIMPRTASKSNAVRQLREKLGCGKIVAFGDGKNDIDLFQLADEAYAVDNACGELKKYATGIISSNNEDGVARWLLEHYE